MTTSAGERSGWNVTNHSRIDCLDSLFNVTYRCIIQNVSCPISFQLSCLYVRFVSFVSFSFVYYICTLQDKHRATKIHN